MPLGPIEVLVIAVVDGVFATKDADGNAAFVEFAELDPNSDAAVLSDLMARVDGLVSDEDVESFTAALEPNSSAAILVFEHTWAKPFRDAVVDAGGILAANVRIPGAVVEEILATVPED